MVDWNRVRELHAQGRDWSEIAGDPKVDFHPESGAGTPGRQLRALYRRRTRDGEGRTPPAAPSGRSRRESERRWTLRRVGYLVFPLVAVWFALAYVAPSPVGLLIPAIPYLALALGGAALLLIYAIWRTGSGPRWSAVYRTSVVGGVVAGLVVAGGIALVGTVVYGCPYLPPASSLTPSGGSGWYSISTSAWHANGVPVVFFYGATWCPYCSASSWSIFKGLSEYASVSNTPTSHSSLGDRAPGTPEIVLAAAQIGTRNGHGPGVDFQVAEDTSGVDGSLPATTNCYQQAYVSAYATGIPFLVINGQYIHLGTLNDPFALGAWNYHNMSDNGPKLVRQSVVNESAVTGGNPWQVVSLQSWYVAAYIARSLGYTGSTLDQLGTLYNWNATTTNAVSSALSTIS